MKIALIHDWLTGMRGGERCLEVFCELFPEADLYTLLHIKGKTSGTIEGMRVRTSFIQNLPFAAKKYRYYLPLFPMAIEQFNLRGYDLVLSSSHCVAKGVITPPDTCHIAYIHSPMRYVWDLYHEYFGPHRTGWLVRKIIPLFVNYLRMWDVTSSHRVDYFIANSINIAGKIKKYYGREAEVIYPPVETDLFRPLNEDGDYYLVVSAFAPYKRIDLAIQAFNRLGFPLKVVGGGQEERRLKSMAGPSIEFLGWVSDKELVSLYARCKALVFPGEEDFGIVPLEAMACGRAVIAYGRGGTVETVIPVQGSRFKVQGSQLTVDSSQMGEEGPTGVFFYEQTPEALMEAVKNFEKNAYIFDKVKTREHALRFDRRVFKDRIKDFIVEKYEEFKKSKK